MTKKYPLYLDGFLADKHTWGKETTIAPYDDEWKVRYCTLCGAMQFTEKGFGQEPRYYSCSVLTDYPGDEAPCLCTGRGYAEAHGLEYAPGKIYGYKDTPDKKVDLDILELM